MKKVSFYHHSIRENVWILLLFMILGLVKTYANEDNLNTWVISQQQRTISGKVTDEQETPLPDVSIVIKNTTKRVATDFDGNFEILAQGKDVLIFSYIGFVKQEIKVKNRNTINLLCI